MCRNEIASQNNNQCTSQYPHNVQQVMSKEKTPVLAGVIPTFERFMTSWEALAKKNPNLRDAINIGLSFATKYYKKMDATKAYIIAMCECRSYCI